MKYPANIVIVVALDKETATFLDELARRENCDRRDLVELAINNYLDLRRSQIEEINKAVGEADRGLFLSDEEATDFMEEFER